MDKKLENYTIVENAKGKAMIALKDFNIGEIISRDQNYLVGTAKETSDNALQIGKDKFVDVAPGDDNNFVNHSCNANVKYDTNIFGYIAIKPIKKDDEITIDYEDYEDDMIQFNVDFDCLCHESNCRGRIVGKKMREKYGKNS